MGRLEGEVAVVKRIAGAGGCAVFHRVDPPVRRGGRPVHLRRQQGRAPRIGPATQDEPIPAKSRLVPGGGASAWWMNVLVLSVLYWLQGLRAGWMGVQNLHALWQVALAIAVVLGVRSLAMKVVGRLVGLETRYRMWETGLTLSVIVAVLGGLFLPPGSHYPKTVRWSYRSELPRLGCRTPPKIAGLAYMALVDSPGERTGRMCAGSRDRPARAGLSTSSG